ncbi:hypothetical protein P9112_012126 [Eukaryota sp. TZLM1-RC]
MSCITLQLGQYGNQLGSSFLQSMLQQCSKELLDYNNTFFRTSKSNPLLLIPRTILADLEPKVVETVAATQSNYCKYDPTNMFCSAGGASNNWALGYFSSMALHSIMDLVRREAERADNLSTIMLLQSLSGGTGSGLGSALMEALADEFHDSFLLSQVIFPYSSGEVIVHSFNSALTLAKLLDCCDGVITASNDTLSSIVSRSLHIKNPSFADLNSLLSHNLGTVFFPGSNNLSLNQLVGNVFTNPGLKMASVFVNPIIASKVLEFTKNKWETLISNQVQMVASGNMIGESVDYNRKDLIFSSAGNLWGNHSNHYVPLVQNCFSSKLSSSSPSHSCFGSCDQQFLGVEKLVGSLAVSSCQADFLEPVCRRASLLLSSNSYVHHYERYGIGGCELRNAIAVLESVKGNYGDLR